MSTVKAAAFNNPSAPSGGLAIDASGNVSGAGMDLIVSQSFTAASAVNINNCFTSEYENYRIVVTVDTTSTGLQVRARLRASGVDQGTDYWYGNVRGAYGSGSIANDYSTAVTQAAFYLFGPPSGAAGHFAGDILFPALPKITQLNGLGIDAHTGGYSRTVGGILNTTSAYDGFTLLTDVGTITGTLRVYGLRN